MQNGIINTLLILFSGSLLMAGCNLFNNPLPEKARLQITADEIEEAELVISLNFLASREAEEQDGIIVGDQTVILPISVDSMTVTLPFDEEFDISNHRKFFAELKIPEEYVNTDLAMKGWIDGDEKFHGTAEMQEDGMLRFIYLFRSGEGVVIRPQP